MSISKGETLNLLLWFTKEIFYLLYLSSELRYKLKKHVYKHDT